MNTYEILRSARSIHLLALTTLFQAAAWGQLQITSFQGDGTLTWNDPGATGTNNYAVEWASSLNGNWSSWQDAAGRLSGLGASGSVAVPMFYRVVATDPTNAATQRYTYFQELPPLDPLTPLATNEMRIIFMGSMIPLPVRRAQAEMSVFVQVGWSNDPNDRVYGGRARDQFIFDCGAGCSANFAAAVVGFRRMDKVFINHLHGDHMSDLSHIYCFGPAADRKTPLYVWGSKPSGVENPASPGTFYDDGTSNFCACLRQALRWHSESFSFQSTCYSNYVPPTKEQWGLPHDPVPVCGDSPYDAYAMVPIELDFEKIGGVAYDNAATEAKVTHYPVIHCRKGSMGYKLEWTTPEGKTLSMIYSSDTKPETNSIAQASNNGNGVDVFIHEMVVPPAVWAYKNMGLSAAPVEGDALYPEYVQTVQGLTFVQNSSHTPQGAFGYLLSQIEPKPRLTVATHFPVADDTVASAFVSVTNHCPTVQMGRDLVWSFDLMALRVFPDRIEQRRLAVSDYSFNPPVQLDGGTCPPKYNDGNGSGNPYAQIDTSASISPTNTDGSVNYRIDGY
ncbi:MAG TPA: MBL fold metallo-hydrolase [Kiritimatiellia bacterium]|nr:MBL fold metallo-hydrolase [Kiritimatiellia bacterium]HPS07598.1 MBL fold metallo-hydrolase [Kiritimatiellia bacterium]